MAVFKCKMCGGTIEFEEGATVGICDSCGTKQTLPRLDDDKKANLYDRANHFRRNNDFDKAMGIYEQILNEDNTDAEAYWSLVLCRYGIEYVEDPSSHKRIPTVNRTQYTSIFSDEDYKSAIKHADGYQKVLYEEEAKVIDDIQKGILEISNREEPFDVFICYKETDESGRRTQDSVLANDLYHQLTQEGFKVFFARITLEDKLGTAYEPYIFAALNSSKVMVVLGTRPEHFNAVWVKNEWSRYLALIKSGAKKMLIPAYRDMDPYDLPEEFSHLQAQDMSKLGFMQDLIRGIKKITSDNNEPKETVRETVVVNGGSTAGTAAPLLKRAFMFLEDGNFEEADEYCEKVLDMDPENAEAYLGKLMAEYKVSKEEDLKDCKKEFYNSGNYQKVLKFADEELKEKIENIRLEKIYNTAVDMMERAHLERKEDKYKNIASQFKTITGYKDADELAQKCLEEAEACHKDWVYDHAKANMGDHEIQGYEAAIKEFQSISGWRDADEYINICKQKIEELKKVQIAIKRRNKIMAIGALIVMVGIIIAVFVKNVIIPPIKYNEAVSIYNDGNYSEAVAKFKELGDYKDSQQYIVNSETEIKYIEATTLYNNGNYLEAITKFKELGDYKDSQQYIVNSETEIKYIEATTLYNNGNYLEAITKFKELGDYKDSHEKISSAYTLYLKIVSVGNNIFFGSYEQDNNTSNGKEYIEWVVLAKENNRALLISKYALDSKEYNTEYKDITWETCSLRNWLNNGFINEAFNTEEQARIITTDLPASPNPEYDTNPGNPTQDRVFLLGIDEVNSFFHSDKERQCSATPYAEAQGAYISDGRCWWRLRSPGCDQDTATSVTPRGSCHYIGIYVYDSVLGVRPALWINLDS